MEGELEFEALRAQMVQEIYKRTSANSTVLDAFRSVDRRDYVPTFLVPRATRGIKPGTWERRTESDGSAWARCLYSAESALVVKLSREGQPMSSSTAPWLMAMMIDALALTERTKILEIGTGTGYNAAVIAHALSRGGRIVTVELDKELFESAKTKLLKYENVTVRHGDGRAGLPEFAPYDNIVATVAANRIESAWLDQLNVAGRIIVNLQGALSSGLFLGSRTATGIRGRFSEAENTGFLAQPEAARPWHPIPPEDLFDRRHDWRAVMHAEMAETLLQGTNQDALTWLDLMTAPDTYQRALLSGADNDVSRYATLTRGNQRVTIRDSRHKPGQQWRGNETLLEDLGHAYARWNDGHRRSRTGLVVEVSAAEGTRTYSSGKLLCVSGTFAPAHHSDEPGST